MTLVVDASVVVAALVDDGHDGRWTLDILGAEPLVAPHLLPAEVANVLRRAVQTGQLSADLASLSHADLQELPVEYFGYGPLGERAWALRDNVSSYDAWYVALAETLGVTMATLDRRLAAAPGPQCRFLLPDPG